MLPSEVKAFQPAFWGGELYLDIDKAFYREVGSGKLRKGSWFKFLFTLCHLMSLEKEAIKTVPEAGNRLEVWTRKDEVLDACDEDFSACALQT